MARPANSCTPRVSDFRSIDLAGLRRKGACTVGHSGRITWSNRGQETGSRRATRISAVGDLSASRVG
jgi:hypothetical protein